MKKRLKIVADAHIWGVESAFSSLPGFDVDLHILENRAITRDALMDADILLTRSSTRVNATLLQGTSVGFAATATVGDDHYDIPWLERNNIAWASAAGSSTGSVIEYMVSVLLELHAQGLIAIPGTTIGIIGVGRIGKAISDICSALGMKVLCNDPPRARREGEAGFCSLAGILEQADLITLHTPLIAEGTDCTAHLLNNDTLNRFKGRGIINAARGGCIDNPALLAWLNGEPSRFAALDCWEFEPSPSRALVSHPQMVIATAHIAGHSLDGKAANTQYIYNALCHHLQITPVWNTVDHLPPATDPCTLSADGDVWQKLYAAICYLYPLDMDNASMKSWPDLTDSELPNAFTGYRRHYPVRRAWQQLPIHMPDIDTHTMQLAQAIGIKIV